jgi:hypothetical protein
MDEDERVRLEIEPEPTGEERAAIVAALELVLAPERGGAPGAWWAAGLPDAEDELY